MTFKDDGAAAEYRRKAEECLELANRATGEQTVFFLQLAQSWGKLALDTEDRHAKFAGVHMAGDPQSLDSDDRSDA